MAISLLRAMAKVRDEEGHRCRRSAVLNDVTRIKFEWEPGRPQLLALQEVVRLTESMESLYILACDDQFGKGEHHALMYLVTSPKRGSIELTFAVDVAVHLTNRMGSLGIDWEMAGGAAGIGAFVWQVVFGKPFWELLPLKGGRRPRPDDLPIDVLFSFDKITPKTEQAAIRLLKTARDMGAQRISITVRDQPSLELPLDRIPPSPGFRSVRAKPTFGASIRTEGDPRLSKAKRNSLRKRRRSSPPAAPDTGSG
ncbi:hypothetical protein Q0812_10325 [Brevundimonas sp. 2R-24]|uniref:Uncharacterized protein n=1 Tax=Peiella sedimenti TaxID=3061083 RepID=A0ABT8SMW5_9CAUL|nr:hypothetical protein [Caulobacteraceae bacterium XZ-24]